jgi:glycogen synthase
LNLKQEKEMESEIAVGNSRGRSLQPKRRLRVLMTADTIGGVWSYALELTRALASHRVDVALATMGGAPSQQQRTHAKMIPNLILYASDYRLEWMRDPWHDVQAAGRWLLSLEADIQPDLIHLNGFTHGALPWSVPCVVVGHSCVCSWFAAVRGAPAASEWDEYRSRVAAGLRSASLVTAPSNAMLSDLRKHYGDFASAGAIYNGRHAGDYLPAAKEAFVLTAGRLWDEAKNVAILSEVGRKIPWPIYAAGEHQAPEGSHGDVQGLLLLGSLDPTLLAAWLARAAIFVLPARYEPFGLSVLEAALACCALVLGDIPSLREIWGETALFASPNDPDAISAAVRKLIQDPILRDDFAERAHQRALAFTPERMAEGYVKLYYDLLLSHRARQRAEGVE